MPTSRISPLLTLVIMCFLLSSIFWIQLRDEALTVVTSTNPPIPTQYYDQPFTIPPDKIDKMTDENGSEREYVKEQYYINYLEVLKSQHQEMLTNLVELADEIVANNNVYSVTLKKDLPPSQDPHDYMSLSRYFWPNPDKPNGLPYVRIDGIENPEINTIQDYTLMRNLFKEIENLGFAYFFTNNHTYVEKAIYRIDEWFINEKTRMNPNLNYAGFRRGDKIGRRTGVLDIRPIFKMLQSIPLMRSSSKWDFAVERNLRQWFSEYYFWLTTSTIGRKAKTEGLNNHGTHYDVQITFILSFLGRDEEARAYSKQALMNRINIGILPTGQQPYETKRMLSWHYSIFNIQALFLLAERADHYGFKESWNYVGDDGQTLQKSVDYILSYALKDGEGWPFHNIGDFEINDFVKVLELSYVVWGDRKYLKALSSLRPKAKLEQIQKGLIFEDNYLCVWSLMTNRMLWSCIE
ncbi:2329_t:CDS:1 [Funneliformis geosporum]|uniref:4007_t:CDS:1 n=1 Tax=Funneliformis geosporum TaxID=1117311 RepID=A0A9W4SJ82_9GLOM|nr:2329_t:CDS:1 [Funneliformis geosporum]CAI2170311.1 4007_t:CDS:1 [Funneliformis geosporum]